MEVEVKIDLECVEPKIVVFTNEITDEIKELVQRLQIRHVDVITGFAKDSAMILEPSQIYRFYGANQKVYAVTTSGEYTIRKRLYELESQLESTLFVRISNSDIVNIKQIERFDLNFVGTICVQMKNKESVYVSRRYVPKIKQMLGL